MGDAYSWVEPDGTVTTLPVFDPKHGRHMPPIDFASDPVPLGAGSRLRSVRHSERRFDVVTAWRIGSASDVRTDLRAWTRRLDPTRGEGILRCATVAGDTREIACRYIGGIDTFDEIDPRWNVATLEFVATDPYWRDAADTTASFTTGQGLPKFLPGPPFTLSNSGTWAVPAIDNVGDVEAWPVWVVTGPASSVTFDNLATGQSFTLDYVLADGQTVTIDTRPGAKTVRSSDGVNRYANLSASSVLFSLARGTNNLEVTIEGAAESSAVSLAYRLRYLGV
jgi:hypothetical protein